MILQKDLRIDNRVFLPSTGTKHQIVIAIEKDTPKDNRSIALSGNGIYNRTDQLMPIPLSLDVLERFGFRSDYSTFEHIDGSNNGKLFIGWINGDFIVELSNGFKNIHIKLEWVNQLQNLYYFLFNEELNYKVLGVDPNS